MIRATVALARRGRDYAQLPSTLKAALKRDRREGLGPDPGIEWAITEGLHWLARAQDNSSTRDGGVSRHYSLTDGWAASYPETTGYIIPTMLLQARLRSDNRLRARAQQMLDWLVSIQLPGGGFQGGMVNQTPVVPVTFNTGQILMGLAAGVAEFGDVYRGAMVAAGDWLVETQDPDGCWRLFPSPFAGDGDKVYEKHVSWGLIEAERLEHGRGYAEAALRNAQWSLQHQRYNGWFDCCCLEDPTRPLTHTIAYALRGLIEVQSFFDDRLLLVAARRTADGVLSAIRPDGALPGKLDSDWQGTVSWSCLTGNVQIAHSLLILYGKTGHEPYRDAAYGLNCAVRRTLRTDDPDETRGAVKGSFPIDGEYGNFEYLNWATKFAIDSFTAEEETRAEDARLHGDAAGSRPDLIPHSKNIPAFGMTTAAGLLKVAHGAS
jgi:hypothetical protein